MASTIVLVLRVRSEQATGQRPTSDTNHACLSVIIMVCLNHRSQSQRERGPWSRTQPQRASPPPSPWPWPFQFPPPVPVNCTYSTLTAPPYPTHSRIGVCFAPRIYRACILLAYAARAASLDQPDQDPASVNVGCCNCCCWMDARHAMACVRASAINISPRLALSGLAQRPSWRCSELCQYLSLCYSVCLSAGGLFLLSPHPPCP